MTDEKSLVFLEDYNPKNDHDVKTYDVPKGQYPFIPCGAAHPNVTVEIKRKHNGRLVGIHPMKGGDLYVDEPNNLPQQIADTGEYQCVGSMNNVSSRVLFNVIVHGYGHSFTDLGVEITRLGDPGDPWEGSNVTLLCRSSSIPKWYVSRDNDDLSILDLHHRPQEGIENAHEFSRYMILYQLVT